MYLQALHFRDSSNVRISGLSFKNNPRNNIFFHQSRSVQISNIVIDSPGNTPNTDGINIGQSTNVSIANSKIGSGVSFFHIHNVLLFPTVIIRSFSFFRSHLLKNYMKNTGDDCISVTAGSSQINIRNITCGPGHGIRSD